MRNPTSGIVSQAPLGSIQVYSRKVPRPGEARVDHARSARDVGKGVLATLRTRAFEVTILLWSMLFGIVITTWFQVVRRPKQVRFIVRLWCRGFVFAASLVLRIRYRIEGLENLSGGPAILICNHQSCWESIALTALIPHVNVISKRGAMKIPIFGWGLKHAPMTAVDRDGPGSNLRRILREAQQSLREGRSVLIFPEGTRLLPGERLRYQRGFEVLYSRGSVPLVPIAHNSGLCWPSGFAPKKPGHITLRILPPLPPGLKSREAADLIEETINAEKERLATGMQ